MQLTPRLLKRSPLPTQCTLKPKQATSSPNEGRIYPNHSYQSNLLPKLRLLFTHFFVIKCLFNFDLISKLMMHKQEGWRAIDISPSQVQFWKNKACEGEISTMMRKICALNYLLIRSSTHNPNNRTHD